MFFELGQNIILIVASIFCLWKGADWLVASASRLASALKVPDLVIGLTVVAIGTSAPEFAVSVTAALNGMPDISIGNVVGSNIFNLGFILGTAILIREIPTTPRTVYRDLFFLISITILLYFFIFGFQWGQGNNGVYFLSVYESIILIVLLIGYLIFLFCKREPVDDIDTEKLKKWDIIKLLIGVTAVIFGGEILVIGATNVAKTFGLSDWFIGLTIVAIGTSAPEFATTIVSLLKKREGIALGNLIGSDIFNMLGVVGLAGILSGGIHVSPTAQLSLITMLISSLLIVLMVRTSWKLVRIEGVFLLSLCLLRWYIDLVN